MEPISTKDFSNNEYLFVKNLLKKPQFNDFFNQMQEKNGNLKNLENEEHLKVYEKDNIKNTEGFINLLESEIKKIDSDKRNIVISHNFSIYFSKKKGRKLNANISAKCLRRICKRKPKK